MLIISGLERGEKESKHDYKVFGLKIGKIKLLFPEMQQTTDRKAYGKEVD